MPIQDMLAAEIRDGEIAARAAADGRTITGFRGRTQGPGTMFGEQVEPIVGRPVEPVAGLRIGAAADDEAVDPFRVRRVRMPEERQREPFGASEQVLAVAPRPGYRRYWFSDIPGRIARAKRAGYEPVLDADGAPVGRITDRADGRGRSSYLMEIPIQWYQQDMDRQQADLRQRLSDIKRGQAGPGAGDNRYIPKQGITIVGR